MNIREIAKLAGVSVATVSRCLNTPEKLAEPTRKRIMEIIEQQGYMRNPAALSLTTGRTRTIGCVVPSLRNEFFSQLTEGVHSVATGAGYRTLIYISRGDPKFWDDFEQQVIDGLVICGITKENDINTLSSVLKIPHVLIEHTEKMTTAMDTSNVYIEDEAGVNEALDYLYREGNRRIGILCGTKGEDTFLQRRRLRAVDTFFEKHPDAVCLKEYAHFEDPSLTIKACEKLLDRPDPPTAVFAFSDMIAAGALRCLQERGIRVPDDIELIGFDDIPLSNYFTPPLSTISAPNCRLGIKAAEILLDELAGKKEPVHLLYPVELTLRKTTKNTVDRR